MTDWATLKDQKVKTAYVFYMEAQYIPWPSRLWAVISLPIQLARFVITGRFHFGKARNVTLKKVA